MKAYIMDENRNMVIRDMPKPKEAYNNIIVKIVSASICGTDMRTFFKGSDRISVPRILGHEFAGEIVHAGEYAKSIGFEVGDKITAAPAIGCGECWPCKTGHTNMCDNLSTLGFQYDGVFAEYMEIPEQAIKMGNVIKLPKEIDYDDATLIEPAACALNGQSYLHISPGDNVVIYGSGMIGCIHAELAFLKGAEKVIIIEPVEKRGKIALEKVEGVIWLNPNEVNIAEEVMKITNNRGADVVITATSFAPVQSEALEIAAKCGRISLFGGIAGESKGFLDSNLIHYKELQVCGVHATTVDFMKQIIQYMIDGNLDAKKYIELKVGLENIEEGFISVRDKGTMKVVVAF